MEIITSPSKLQQICLERRNQQTIGLVPTMGYFHEGHLSLMDWARKHCDMLIVSLFVNPSQFGPGEDLAAYPRDEERDRQLAREHGVDILFLPSAEAMYAPDHATWVQVPELAKGLCGTTRPLHFQGMATVVTKLLNLTQPHVAVFGEKDWQQLAIIKRMVRDLHMPIRIVGRPTLREKDGLAMSSRNAYLTAEERKHAPRLFQGLAMAAKMVREGERQTKKLRANIMSWYEENLPLGRLDYVAIVDPDSMQEVSKIDGPVLCAVAMYVGKARLIDNILMEPATS